MRIFKKRIAVLLAALMLMSVFSVVAFADEAGSGLLSVASGDEATPGEATPGESTPEETTAPVATVWTVAGDIPNLGDAWTPGNMANAMTEGEDGIFTLTFDSVIAGEYNFKVTNGTWDEAYGKGGDNFYVRLTKDSDLTITFNAETKEIAVDGEYVTTKAPKVEVEPGYFFAGDNGLSGADESWGTKPNEALRMTLAGDGKYYIDFENVAAGTYSFKVIYINKFGKVTWHPGGMGNDSSVEVTEDGSLVRICFEPLIDPEQDTDESSPEAATAEVFANPEDAPELPAVTEPATTETTVPEYETTEPVETTTATEGETTEPVETTTAAEGETTEPVETTTAAEGETTEPVETTTAAEGETTKPVETTAAQDTTTVAPTTTAPATTTAAPANTTKAAAKKTVAPAKKTALKKNPAKIKLAKKTFKVKASKLSKKAVTVKKAIKVTKAKGAVKFKVLKKGTAKKIFKKIKVTKKGNLKIKKGLKKGTYKVKVKVTVNGTKTYDKAKKTLKFKVKVK